MSSKAEEILIPPGSIINKKVYIFLYCLVKNIILNGKQKEKEKVLSQELQNMLDVINKEIKDKNNHINLEYSTQNFNNILNYIKSQNLILAGDILEGILISVFSLAFKTEKENAFGEYLYVDIEEKYKIEESKDLFQWFIKDEFKPKELQNLENLENLLKNKDKKEPEEPILYSILNEIFKVKLINVKEKNKNKNIDKYIYRRNFESEEIKDGNFNKNFQPEKFIKFFLISVYIYYQNKNSPLMKYIPKTTNDKNKKEENKDNIINEKEKKDEEKEKKDEEKEQKDKEEKKDEEEKKELADIPFDFNLGDAKLINTFANSVFSPVKIEPRISQITMSQNNFEESGLYELGKILLFNKNIKKCSFDSSWIESHYLDFLNLGLGIYDNYNLEDLNLAYNKMDKNSEMFLSKMISHLKGLKTINLSCNDIERGVASFFVMLKQLYRKGKTCLENLIINKCQLDNSSFYELGELLKCKYCGLKRLYLNSNIIPRQAHFLRKLKKNKILTEILLNKTNISDNNTNEIMRLISNTQLDTIYLYKNKINNFNDCLRIIGRTKLVKNIENEKEIEKDPSFLLNLDLSENPCLNLNTSKIAILKDLIIDTNLFCLDLSHILLGAKPKDLEENQDNSKYRTEVNSLRDYLNDKKEQYEQDFWDKKCLEYDKKEVEDYLENLEKYDEDIQTNLINQIDKEILESEDAKYPLFLREKIKDKLTTIVQYSGDQCIEFNEKIKQKLITREGKKIERKVGEKIAIQNSDKVDIEEYKKMEKFLLYNMQKQYYEKELKSKENIKLDRKLIII